MQVITPPLQQTAQGSDVKNLHDVLFFLIRQLNDPGLNARFNDTALQEAFKKDVLEQFYGSSTTKLVFFLQEFLQEHQFKMGVVDDLTAQKFNELLRKFGGLGLDQTAGENNFTLTGTVTGIQKNVLPGIYLAISEYDLDVITKITSATTDDKGNFSVSFVYASDLQQADGNTNPDIVFQLTDANQQPIPITDVFITSPGQETAVERISESANAPLVLMNLRPIMSIRIVAAGKERQLTEFERIVQALQPFMRKLSFADLKEDDNNFQISFLSKESGIDKTIITILKNAFENERNSQIPAWAFFGLDRLPFDYDTIPNISEDDMASLLAPLQPAASKEDLKTVAQQIIAYEKEKTIVQRKTSLQAVTSTVLAPIVEPSAQMGKLIDAYARFDGDDITEFWKNMESVPDLTDIIPKVQYGLQLAELTFNNTGLITTLHSRTQSVKELTTISAAEWKDLILQHKDGIPPHITGDDDEQKAANYANGIQKYLELSFSNEYILQKVAQDPGYAQVPTFFNNNPSFNIKETPFDLYVREHADTAWANIENKDHVAEQVRGFQRIHAVTANTSDMMVLLQAGYKSAFQVTSVPQEQFMEQLSGVLPADSALLYYQTASKITATSTLLYHHLYELGTGVKPGVIKNDADDDAIKVLPEWEELFGSLDTCQCKDCLSVYSPAAYFVDLLNIKNGLVKNNSVYINLFARRIDLMYIKLSCENTNTLIPYIDLVNEILETYIANGKLDETTTIDTSAFTGAELAANPQHPTKSSQQAFEDAYNLLKAANYPAGLPFDLPLETARKFLEQQGSSRYEVTRTFKKDATPATAIAIEAERLGISDKEFELLTNEDFLSAASAFVPAIPVYYGYQPSDLTPLLALNNSGPAVEIIQHQLNAIGILPKLIEDGKFGPLTQAAVKKLQANNGLPQTGQLSVADWNNLFPGGNLLGTFTAYVKEFIDRTKIAYTDLIDLLNTQVLNEDQTIVLVLVVPDGVTDVAIWESAHACDLDYTRLLHKNGDPLTDAELSGFARFIRLWKKLSITIRELDIIMTGLGQKEVGHEVLLNLPNILDLSQRLRIPYEQLMAFWSDIPTWGKQSLFEKMFFNKAALQPDDIFTLDSAGKELLNTAALVVDHIPALLAAFKITEADLRLIFESAALDITSATLDISLISVIYRHVLLAKGAKLSVVDLVNLVTLSGVSPWGTTFTVAAFLTLADKCRQSGLSVAQQTYIYLHTTDDNSPWLPSRDSVMRLSQDLHKGFLKIVDDTAIKNDTVQEEFLKTQLGVLFEEPQASGILLSLKETTTYEFPLPAAFTNFDDITALLKPADKYLIVKLKYDGAKLTFMGAMKDAENAALKLLSANGAYQNSLDALLQQPRTLLANDLSAFLLPAAVDSLINTNTEDQEKFKAIYKLLLPFITSTLNDKLIKGQLSAALMTDATFIDTLNSISNNFWTGSIQKNILPLALNGLTGAYFDNTGTIKIQQNDSRIDKNWGAGSENSGLIGTDNFKVVWTGKLIVPKTEQFTFTVKKDVDATVNLKINGQSVQWITKTADTLISENMPLKTGDTPDLLLTYTEGINDSMISLSWSSQTIPLTIIPSENLYPSQPFESFYRLFILLHKITLLNTALQLTQAELNYFSANSKDFAGFDLSILPTETPKPYVPAAFDQWLRMLDYKKLRTALAACENTLLAIFTAADTAFRFGDSILPDPPTADNDKKKKELFSALATQIVQITGWDATELAALIGDDIVAMVKPYQLSGGYFDVQPGDLKNEIVLLQIWKCLALSDKIGVSVEKITEWVNSPTDFTQVQDIKRTLRAKYGETDWADVAKSVNDKLRVMQRDALVAYILSLPAIEQAQVLDTNGLFSYFLIDVEMDACMQTSRIKQAISSVQLYFQRCLMNLESKVLPSQIDPQLWAWMKIYRLWEANRRIFLYPENWIEPELRDNKTPFFKELESELLQNEINNDNVEKTLMNYLEKLDDVAKLDICGLHEDTEAGEIHVFGRTLNTPSVYYYRKLDQATNIWTAWEKAAIDIQGKEDGNDSGVHLIPVVWNRRLYLFWPVFTAKTEKQTSLEKELDVEAAGRWDIQFAWSEYWQNKWTPKKLSKEVFRSVASTVDKKISVNEYSLLILILVGPDGKPLPPKDGVDKEVTTRVDLETFEHYTYLPKQSEHYFKPLFTDGELVINIYRNYNVNVDGIYLQKRVITKMSGPASNITNAIIEKKSLSLNFASNEFEGMFKFSGCHNKVAVVTNTDFKTIVLPRPLSSPPGTINFYQEFASTNQISTKLELLDVTKTPIPLLKTSQGIFQQYKSNITSFYKTYKFFYEDRLRNYYVTPENNLQLRHGLTATEKTDFIRLVATQDRISVKPIERIPPINVTQLAAPRQSTITAAAVVNNPVFASRATDVNQVLVPIYLAYQDTAQLAFTFHTHYHGYVCAFIKALNHGGIDELLTLKSQIQDGLLLFNPNPFDLKYGPDPKNVTKPHPFTHVEFEQTAAYGDYNWELFYHIPMLIANRLSANQRFEEASRWYQFIFNPTTNTPVFAGNETTRYWNVLPFVQTPKETIQELMNKLQSKDATQKNEIETAIAAWRKDPFNPHLVARMRLIAYMKNTVMKYLDNLIAWGDQLFSRDTIESINEATQYYIMAAEILGRYPQKIPMKGQVSPKSFSELLPTLDAFSNPMVKMETIFPFFDAGPVNNLSKSPTTFSNIASTLYFCIPDNDKLLGYWDLVGDRLFKIRHCQNIDGVERQLALFEPRIDPALLVRAVANGIDINSLLSEINAPLPHYRFSYMIEKASQMCGYLTSIGASYLAALEKQDAEQLSVLKASQETTMNTLVKQIKQSQIQEATSTREGLEKTKAVTQGKFDYYTRLITAGLNAGENEQLDKSGLARQRQEDASLVEISASLANIVPNFTFPAFGGSFGGSNVGAALNAWARSVNNIAGGYTFESSSAAIMGSNMRRADDWGFQQKTAGIELQQIDKQILAAQIREDITNNDLNNQDRLIEHSQATEEFYRNKFTNQELFGWMVGEMAACFFPYYQLVYAWAKSAERLYRFELGISSSNFISFGYWDSFRKGLMAGEKLQLALKQMERSYIELNKREYELTKNISLLQTNPLALLALKETGACVIELPESVFDMDYPGQYMRKIKTVGLSIPCIVGPYTSINCTLTLLKSQLRIKNILSAGLYAEQDEDDRFETRLSATNAIATSHAQNDTGMFELSFRDERLLPFEGAGVISRWEIRMPIETNQFNRDSVSDLILQIKYTAREGGKLLANTAIKEMKSSPKIGARMFSLKNEFPNEWHRFITPPEPAKDQDLQPGITKDRFPFFANTGTISITNIAVLIDSSASTMPDLSVTSPGNTTKPYKFSKVPEKYGPLFTGRPSSDWTTPEDPGVWKIINPAANAIKLNKDNCNDIIMIISYEVA